MDAETSASLASYLIARSRQRTRAVTAVLEGMTLRELYLVREAAVMGFFQGHRMHGGFNPNTEWPKDSIVLNEVIAGCIANPDLYPTITGYQREEEDDG